MGDKNTIVNGRTSDGRWALGHLPTYRPMPRIYDDMRHGRWRPPPILNHPTIADLHWAAGFLEGEGSFHAYRLKGTGYVVIQVTATQAESPEPLLRLHSIFGGGITRNIPQRSPRHKKQERWILGGSKAAALMMTLFKLLSPRRQGQIRHALDLWHLAKPRPEYRAICPNGHNYNPVNTYRNPNGHRRCRQCRRNTRERYELRRATST